MVVGIAIGVLTMNHWSFAIATTLAIFLGFAAGQRIAHGRNVRAAVKYVMQMGGKDAFLDQSGREMLTVWIPLDHQLSDRDRAFAKRLGEGMKNAVADNAARFAGISTSSSQVGVMILGRDAEVVLDAIRPYFKQHCPRGTFVTRRRVIPREETWDAERHTWPRPKPLFEDDVIPESAWGF